MGYGDWLPSPHGMPFRWGWGDKVQGISWDTCPASDLNRTHLLSQRWVNKAPLIGREETEARCGRVRQSRKGRCDFLGESSPAPACSPASPRGRHSFLHLAGEPLCYGDID